MDQPELLRILACGEDSRHQFKQTVSQPDALAAELIALANSVGGQLFIGVDDNGQVTGLSPEDVRRINQLLSNTASNNVRPPLNPVTTNIPTVNGLVMVVEIEEGNNKPYVDVQGRIWVKNGADKRHVTAREELRRMFQNADLVYADEVPAHPATVEDIDEREFVRYFERRYHKQVASMGMSLAQLLQNLNLARDGVPTLAGLLLFGKMPQTFKPAFVIKAVAFPGKILHDNRYLDSEDIDGTLPEMYQRGIAFIRRNLRHVQGQQGFNSPGLLEVPEAVFEELLVNALVHRDYFLSAPIRLLIFSDRIEINSPGHLPNHLDAEKIRFGVSNLRNPALASHAFHMLPYRGLGSGIPRATVAWTGIDFCDDRKMNQFASIVGRPDIAENEIVSQPESEPKTEGEPESQPESEPKTGGEPESRPESQPESEPKTGGEPESRPESQPESEPLAARIIALLDNGALSKTEISNALGQRTVSGPLNKSIRALLAQNRIEMTLPNTPKSRLQKYRLVKRQA